METTVLQPPVVNEDCPVSLAGESGLFNLDDPLLNQFQRSFSRGTENVAAVMASAVAFVTTKRWESFLSHMVPSVTDAQKRKLLSDPLFHQKDLFAPATIEATLQAAGDVVHLGDGPTIPLRVRLGILLARGGILLPARRVCSRTIRLPMNDSLLLVLVLLCLGDNHKPSHLTSLPQIRPDAHFTKGGDSLSLSPPPPLSDA